MLTSAAYSASLESIRALQSREQADPRLNPACHSILYDHGAPTSKAIVFLHGITSSPVQFQQLGELFHRRGYNVVIPRMPRHGYRDRLTREHAGITRAEYEAYALEGVSLGRGLGERLAVAGLS